MVVMGIVAVMFAGACWFFRSCRSNKAHHIPSCSIGASAEPQGGER
jgi:hypothetical protein